MPLTNFTNLDFDQIKSTLKDYLRSNSNFTDYDFEGSNLSTILDVLAYNTYITAYNANMVANEVFIDSATLRENVVSLARNIGYVPRSRKSSRAVISFFVDTNANTDSTVTPASITLRKGIVATSASVFGGKSYTFSILEDITVPVRNGIAEFNNIPIYEGFLLNQKFQYDSYNQNQRFILPNSGIDTDLMVVKVKDIVETKYTLKENLFEINKDSKVYFLQEIEDERYEIIFGDGIFGKKLEQGNEISIDYITSNGENANGGNRFTFAGNLFYVRNSVENVVTTGISLITTQISASGGESIEPVDSIKKFAPKIYSSHNRAVTADDYETLIPTKIYPETESISVFGGEELIPPQYGKVFISIKPKNGDFIPNLIKENIKLKLKKYSVAGIVPEILDLKYLFIETDSKVYYNSNLSSTPQQVSGLIRSNVAKYSESSELNKYGARFKYSKFLKIIDDSHNSITSNITTIQIRRDLRVIVNSITEYQIGFGNEFDVLRTGGYNIKSSGFKVAGFSETLYISDVPSSNKITGEIFVFTLPSPSSFTPNIIQRNIGSINYQKGIITINPVNIISTSKQKDGQPTLEISAVPKSNDIIGLLDLYLRLDNSNCNFEMIVDSISSGLDPSASNYVVSPNYNPGNLVRS